MKSLNVRGIPFFAREGTVDEGVIHEVVEGDVYQLDKITLRPNPNIVDVGGHIGSFTKLAAWKWPHGTFFVYEANPRNWEVLDANLQDISNKTSIFHGACVGEIPVNKRIVISKDEADRITGGWGIVFTSTAYEESSDSATETIDNFYSLSDLLPALDKVDILKLDCEGSEFSIIGALTKEELYNIDYIVAEVHVGATSHTPIKYPEFRAKILRQFVCPQLEARRVVAPNDIFNIVACNRKLIPSRQQ
jgi:FkbM family methyltransferase